MDYQGPTAEDLRNIRALNIAFLRASNAGDCSLVNGDSRVPLTELTMRRLSAAPFLLFSFRERDADFWRGVLGDDPQEDLLQRAPTERLRELQVAGLGFLWQLSRRNPYVARLVCGAPSNWCESVASLTLVSLISRAAGRGDLTVPRFDAGDHVAHRLLQSGGSARPRLQHMSQQFALQAMLTRGPTLQYDKLPAAACRLPDAAKRVADRDTKRGSKV